MRMTVYTSHYRQGADHPHPAAIRDLEDVTRAVRERHRDLPMGIAGYSSGGFWALHMAQHPPDEKPFAFCLATNPVAHPGLRAKYLRSCLSGNWEGEGYTVSLEKGTAERMLGTQTGYWETQEAMDRVGDQLGPGTCPTMVVLGGLDGNVPEQVTAGLMLWIPEPKVIVVEYGDHSCGVATKPEEHPESYLYAVREFLMVAITERQ